MIIVLQKFKVAVKSVLRTRLLCLHREPLYKLYMKFTFYYFRFLQNLSVLKIERVFVNNYYIKFAYHTVSISYFLHR